MSTFDGQTLITPYASGPVTPDITFGDTETITVAELKIGDFIVSVPTQNGVRGLKVDSAVRDLRPDYTSWTRSSGYRRPRIQIESRVIMVHSLKSAGMNYPLDFIVQARRPVTP